MFVIGKQGKNGVLFHSKYAHSDEAFVWHSRSAAEEALPNIAATRPGEWAVYELQCVSKLVHKIEVVQE